MSEVKYPRGWFAVAPSVAVATMASTVRFFGRDIVLFRGKSGRAYAVDPHCPHLGAHLGGGRGTEMMRSSERHDLIAKIAPYNRRPDEVELMRLTRAAGRTVGEEIACPFHGWRFDGATGKCAGVPYSDKCPDVKLTTWPVEERDGWVHVWHGMQTTMDHPTWAFPVVEVHTDWTPLSDAVYTFPANFLDVLENFADIAHLVAVHASRNPRYTREAEVSGHVRDSWAAFEAPTHGVMPSDIRQQRIARRIVEGRPQPELYVGVEAHFHLVGIGYGSVTSEVKQFGVRMRNFFYVTPVDERRVQVVVRSQVHKSAPPEVEMLYYAATLRDFEADVAVWEHKVRLERPVLVPGDGPIREYRAWAKQFYE